MRFGQFNRWAAVGLAVVVALLFVADQAQAYKSWSSFSAAEKESVFQWLLCGDPSKPVCPNEGPVDNATAQRLWQGEKALTIKATPPNVTPPAARAQFGRFHQMMWQVRQKAGMLPSWQRAFSSSFGAVTGVATAGYLGLNIGSALNNRFFRFGLSRGEVVFPAISDVALQPLEKGQFLPGAGIMQEGGGSYIPVPSPIDGFYVQVQRGGNWFSHWSESDECPSLPPEFGNPEGFLAITSGLSRCLLGYTPPPFAEPIYAPYEDNAVIGRTPGLPLGPPTHSPSETGEGALPGGESERFGNGASPTTDAQKRAALDTYMSDESDHFADLQREWMDFIMDPLNDPDNNPVVPKGSIPDCQTLSLNACIEALQAAGFGVYVAEELSFEEAEPIPQAQAAEVKRTVPAGGTFTALDDEVVIEHNPVNDDDMPRMVPAPLAPGDSTSGQGETESEYRERMAGAPFMFNMSGSDAEVLPDSAPNLDYGPDSVVGSSPAPGSRAHKGAEVTPRVNPTSAPPFGGGGYSCGLVAPPATFNLDPIKNANPGNVFPFAVVGFLASSTGGLALSAERPLATFSVFGETADTGFLENFDPVIAIFRATLAFLLWIGAAWFLYGRTIGRDT